jgi:pyridoxine 5-phosphate synthase
MRLSINIDHLATLRNARGGTVPDPIEAALISERAGADGIVCHLREDRRHIRDADLVKLRKVITTKLDLEMAATPEIIRIALQVKPNLVTLVPEKREELTTVGGLNVVRLKSALKKTISKFHDHGIPVSLFIDPVHDQIKTAKDINSDMIEIHTGEYANALTSRQRRRHLVIISQMAKFASSLELGVNAGHGLDYNNIKQIAAMKEIEEVSIGHAVIVRAVFVGLEGAVSEMNRLVKGK